MPSPVIPAATEYLANDASRPRIVLKEEAIRYSRHQIEFAHSYTKPFTQPNGFVYKTPPVQWIQPMPCSRDDESC